MEDVLARVWENLVGRVGGPLTFRLILQPTMAAILAIRAGVKDAREGRPIYFWAVFTDPMNRRALLQEGWKDVAKVFVIAIMIDCIYQIIELRWFYPLEVLMVAAILAVLPYLLIRGPLNRVVRRWHRGVGGCR